jgi:hypothetical protein
MNGKLIVALLVVLAGAAAGYHFWPRSETVTARPPEVAIPPPIAQPIEPKVAHPIETIAMVKKPAEIREPIPVLAASDEALSRWLSAILEPTAYEGLLRFDQLIPRIVATVDNLSSGQVATKILPVMTARGNMAVINDGAVTILDSENFSRYQDYINLFEVLDTELLIETYLRYYPLFQQSYEDLGYPDQYFNDRLVEVIDHLLETPEPSGAIYLVKPEANYLFADPALERLSAGQKTLIRMGNENATRIKDKLSLIRDRVSGKNAM